MKRILVTADSHGKQDKLTTIVNKNKDVYMWIHLGDYVIDGIIVARKVNMKVECIRANGDFSNIAPYSKEIIIDGKRILAVHGHIQDVKTSLNRLGLFGWERKADIVLYGHTHIPEFGLNKLYFLNPGAVMNGKYAILTIDGDKINSELLSI